MFLVAELAFDHSSILSMFGNKARKRGAEFCEYLYSGSAAHYENTGKSGVVILFWPDPVASGTPGECGLSLRRIQDGQTQILHDDRLRASVEEDERHSDMRLAARCGRSEGVRSVGLKRPLTRIEPPERTDGE